MQGSSINLQKQPTMREDFLYYVWKLQYFDKRMLATCQGEPLSISYPGTRNDHAGPDFLNGSITINDVTWHGHIEIHINASDWHAHQHHADRAYDMSSCTWYGTTIKIFGSEMVQLSLPWV
jgi:hypothetical protein